MSTKLEISDEQLKQILAEVETELETMLKTEKPLAKAFGENDEDDAGKMAAKPEDTGPSADAPMTSTPGGAGGIPGAPLDPQAEAAPEAAPEMEMPGHEGMAPEQEGMDPAMDQAPDFDSLKGEYSALSPEELKMHFMAAKEALFALMGGHGEADPMGAPEVPAMAPPAQDMAMKMELEAVGPNKKASAPSKMRLEEVAPEGKFGAPKPNRLEEVYVEAKKSEKDSHELEELRKSVKDQDLALNQLVDAVKMVFERPERKAVTSINAVTKPGDAPEAKFLSKSEAMSKLSEVAKTNLKKSDRELINAYCVGKISIDKIDHLLK